MYKVLINAYAVSPNWGSEPGMGWNWIINLAKYCELYVITEGQWRNEIEQSISDAICNGIDKSGHLTKEQADRLHFYYNPVSEKVRQMCWNQGDWRFYYYYKKWQKHTLKIARSIFRSVDIDIIHQLNMIGYREPGFLWKVSNKPFVWGPFGGLELMNESYLEEESFKTRCLTILKNRINDWQRRHQRRFMEVLKRADGLCCATSGVYDFISSYYRHDANLLNETGCYVRHSEVDIKNKDTFDIIWVGKFDYRKQLGIALKAMQLLENFSDIHLHIYGDGYAEDIKRYHNMSDSLGISDNVHWYGKVANSDVQTKMRESDLMIFTSIMEGTPHVVMEALGNNLPVVCFDTCGQGDCIDDSCGIKIPLSNPQQSVYDFASAIESLYKNPDKLRQLKVQCHDRQIQLSWDNKVKAMLSIYQEAIDHFNKIRTK